ncbi:MAG: hypothetical protein JWQ70_2246 [Aeromicrobium sp.]|nr:hypothetical protein [Aeromicrobium sp.]
MGGARLPVAVFTVGCFALIVGAAVFGHSGFGDLELYHQWVRAGVEHGRWPVLDDAWVYPIGALLPMALMAPFATMGPALLLWTMGVVAINAVAITALVRHGGAGRQAAWWWVCFALLLGPVAIGRLEAFAIPLTILAAQCVVRRPTVAAALLTLAGWIKLAPIVLLLPMLVTTRRRASSVILSAVAVTTIIIGPVVAEGGSSRLLSFLDAQSTRGLQVESVPASITTILRWFGVAAAPHRNRALDVWEISGSAAGRIAALSDLALPIMLVAVMAIGVSAVRRGRTDSVGALALTWLALSLSLVVFNKVGSAQYLTWPAAAVVLGLLSRSHDAFWRRVSSLFLAAAVLTQCIYPYLYAQLLDGRPLPTVILLVRNGLLLWLLALAMRELARSGTDRVYRRRQRESTDITEGGADMVSRRTRLLLGKRQSNEWGVTAIEYAVMASAIVAIIVAAVAILAPKILGAFSAIPS